MHGMLSLAVLGAGLAGLAGLAGYVAVRLYRDCPAPRAHLAAAGTAAGDQAEAPEPADR